MLNAAVQETIKEARIRYRRHKGLVGRHEKDNALLLFM